MDIVSIENDFRSQVSGQIELQAEGQGRFLVFTPFQFTDGDHFGIVLKRESGKWILTDEASTLMHLSYSIDDEALSSGNRSEIISSALSRFYVENRNGELVLPVEDERFGEALFSFVQALTNVSDVSYLSRERVRSTFLEDLKQFLKDKVVEDRLTFDWHDQQRDPKGFYPVDCRINGMPRPL